MKTYMPIWETKQIFYKSKGSHENQPCAKLPECFSSKYSFFLKLSHAPDCRRIVFQLLFF